VERLFELQGNDVEGGNDPLSVCCRQRGEQTVSNALRGSVGFDVMDDGCATLGQVDNLSGLRPSPTTRSTARNARPSAKAAQPYL
jgi:hypothetical protein